MAELRNYRSQTGAAGYADASIDMGLRAHMLRVYNYMGVGIALTGIVAFLTSYLATTTDPSVAVGTLRNGVMVTQLGATLYGSGLQWVIMLAPLAFIFLLSFRIDKMSTASAQMTFWAFAAVMGLSLSSIFLVFTGASIAKTFFVTAATFGALSLYGYTTKRDLTGVGTFMFMGLIGLIIASIINVIWPSGMLSFVISAAGVVIFAGLTAYDTQKIKELYYELDESDVAGRKAIMGALNLYLDFINLFQSLLYFLGDRE